MGHRHIVATDGTEYSDASSDYVGSMRIFRKDYAPDNESKISDGSKATQLSKSCGTRTPCSSSLVSSAGAFQRSRFSVDSEDPLWEDALNIVYETQKEVASLTHQVRESPPEQRRAFLAGVRALQTDPVYKNALALLENGEKKFMPDCSLKWDCCSSMPQL